MVPVPGPLIRHETQTQVPTRYTVQRQQGQPEIAHPEQRTHIAPTPKGWQRAPQQQGGMRDPQQRPQEHNQSGHQEGHQNADHSGGDHDRHH